MLVTWNTRTSTCFKSSYLTSFAQIPVYTTTSYHNHNLVQWARCMIKIKLSVVSTVAVFFDTLSISIWRIHPKLCEKSHLSGIKIKFCQGKCTFFNCTLAWSALPWNCWNRHVLTCKPFDLPNQTSMLQELYALEASKYFQTVRATFFPSPPHSWLNCPWEAWLFHKIRHREVPYLLPAWAYCPQSHLDFEWPKLKQNWHAAWWVAKCLNLGYISQKCRPPNATIDKLTIQYERIPVLALLALFHSL